MPARPQLRPGEFSKPSNLGFAHALSRHKCEYAGSGFGWSRCRSALLPAPGQVNDMLRRWLNLFVLLGGLSPHIAAPAQTQPYTIPVAPRFNAIANHLNTGRNTLNEVLPNGPVGPRLYKWNPARQAFTQPAKYTALVGWTTPEPLVATLGPGEGAFLEVASQFNVTFRGQAQQPQVRTDVVAGYNFISCQTTQRCSFVEVLGFAPLAGDRVYKFDAPISLLTTNPSQIASSIHRYDGRNWDTVPFF